MIQICVWTVISRLQKNQWYFLIHSKNNKNKLIFYLVASTVWKVVLKTRRKAVGSWLKTEKPQCFDFEFQTVAHVIIDGRYIYATCTSPICPPNFCINFVFHFSWVLQPSQEKLKTMLMQNFGGQIRCIMRDVQVAYRVLKWWRHKN